jgi:hypothetical protein
MAVAAGDGDEVPVGKTTGVLHAAKSRIRAAAARIRTSE